MMKRTNIKRETTFKCEANPNKNADNLLKLRRINLLTLLCDDDFEFLICFRSSPKFFNSLLLLLWWLIISILADTSLKVCFLNNFEFDLFFGYWILSELLDSLPSPRSAYTYWFLCGRFLVYLVAEKCNLFWFSL